MKRLWYRFLFRKNVRLAKRLPEAYKLYFRGTKFWERKS